ncbi:hypothetical protein NEMBOFW57_000289 [Staphylotrichum longicolle]|uniref:Uncharacterized protein n=1 Tax=Staphylotrichum longicolle TaxID=669026 RepID=A0AAD4EZL8_9PEZI|nr:hypothetical protein NEMBOFW57_000289 [Staphylotrichum longicolle]
MPPTLDTTTLNTAIASLAPALELLERFHHRNKNQHRLSKWWARPTCSGGMAFTQLSADRQFAHLGLMLLGVLAQVDQAVAPFAPASTSSQDETAEQAPGADRTAASEQAATEQEDVEMSLVTDMGVAVSREEIMASIEQDSTPTFTQPSTQPTRPHPRSISLPTNPPARQIKNLIDQTRGGVHTEPASKEPSLDPTKPKRKKPARKRGDEFDAIFGAFDRPTSSRKPSSTPAPSKTEPPPQASKEDSRSTVPSLEHTPNLDPTEPPKKKKKKAREGGLEGAGDEFDDIFGSLDSSKPKTKKKKQKKGGDEFDDIFGGL